ncbi:MAG: helix-turn-helix domain-containing protein, partial [Alphaproteobacteria bacterium]|nr:helix-turn-helix domain-containing protein [Alphaproteobacteria bacterium]
GGVSAERVGLGPDSDFAGSVRRVTAGGGRFTDITTPFLRVHRPYDLSAGDLQLTLVLDGAIVARGGGVPTVVGPGTLRLVDLSPRFESRWHGRHLRFNLPRALLASALDGDLGTLHGRVLPQRRLTPLLAEHLRALATLAAAADETACGAALRMTTELAVTTLQLEFGETLRRHATVADDLFAAACREIELHLGMPDLSPLVIAARLGCSRATLYRVFAKRELSVADHIRERRLARCRAAIEASTGSSETIADLAFGAGFENAVHFSRLFKARFGVSPSDYRRRIVAERAEAGATGDDPAL